MYYVKIDDCGDYLYYPGDPRCTLGDIRLKLALNDAGTLEFNIYSNHPHFDHLEVRKTMLSFYRDDTLLFSGEVREIEADMSNVHRVYCVGALSFLYDTIQPQAEYRNCTAANFVAALLQNHNDQAALDTSSTRKIIRPGIIGISFSSTAARRYTNLENTHAALMEEVIKPLACYMRVRKAADGSNLLDIVSLEDYGVEAAQIIRLGENLLDFSQSLTADDVITALIPIGKKKENVERTSEDIEALDAYVNIAQVNDGKNYLYLPAAVKNYGWVCAVKQWEETFVPTTLKNQGQAYLESGQYANLSLSMTAIDLSELNANFESFNLGDMIHVLAEPYGLDRWFPVTEMEIQPLQPGSNKLTLGSSSASLTKLSTNLGGVRTPTESSLVEYTSDPNFRNYVSNPTYSTFNSTDESEFEVQQVPIVTNWQGSLSNFTDVEQGEVPPCTYSMTYIITTFRGQIHCFQPSLGVYQEYFSNVDSKIWHKFSLYEETATTTGNSHSAMEGVGTYTMPVKINAATYVTPVGQVRPNFSTRNIPETLFKKWFVEAGFPEAHNELMIQFLYDFSQPDPPESVVTVIANRRLKTRRWHPVGTTAAARISKTADGLRMKDGVNMSIRIPVSQTVHNAFVQIDIRKILPATFVGPFEIRIIDKDISRTLLSLRPDDISEAFQTVTVSVGDVTPKGEDIYFSYFELDIYNQIADVEIRNFHFYGDRYAYENNDYKDTWGW